MVDIPRVWPARAKDDKYASSSDELHIAATNNTLPKYEDCQPESKCDSYYFKAAQWHINHCSQKLY